MPLVLLGRVLAQASDGGLGRRSVYVSRRNALRATSELARSRREREEAEEFVRRVSTRTDRARSSRIS